jgi:hypothetical protein
MVRNLAAASSIASGIPSSARQIGTIVDNAGVDREIPAHRARPVLQQPTAGEDSISPGLASPSGKASGPTATAPHR